MSARIGLRQKAPLTPEDLGIDTQPSGHNGGLIVVGSYVPKTTKQVSFFFWVSLFVLIQLSTDCASLQQIFFIFFFFESILLATAMSKQIYSHASQLLEFVLVQAGYRTESTVQRHCRMHYSAWLFPLWLLPYPQISNCSSLMLIFLHGDLMITYGWIPVEDVPSAGLGFSAWVLKLLLPKKKLA